MIFKAVISNRANPDFGQTTIPFPIPDSEYDRTIGLLEDMNNGLEEQADEMRERIMGGERATCCEALDVIGEYVNITGPDDQKEAIQMGGITFGQ